uniref:Bestrophin homolog n=1 Tax=Parascaris equorum TaxID=6256 RepID=A0A914S985_PAREQ
MVHTLLYNCVLLSIPFHNDRRSTNGTEYRKIPTRKRPKTFENLITYLNKQLNYIPLTFILGFYGSFAPNIRLVRICKCFAIIARRAEKIACDAMTNKLCDVSFFLSRNMGLLYLSFSRTKTMPIRFEFSLRVLDSMLRQ